MSYDIVFVGQIATGTVVPFGAPPFVDECSPVVFAACAASCLGKKIAVVTKVPGDGTHLLDSLEAARVRVFGGPGEVGLYRVVFPTANVDERQPFLVKGGDDLSIGDMPPFGPCLVHLCCMGGRDAQIELIRALKARGFRLSLDVQGLVLRPDPHTGALRPCDVPEKKEILPMAELVKLDAVEASTLTGRAPVEEQAKVLEAWGYAGRRSSPPPKGSSREATGNRPSQGSATG